MSVVEAAGESIRARVVKILADSSRSRVRPNDVRDSDSLTDDLDIDSLGVVEVVMAIEEEFRVEIPDPDLTGITTAGQVITLVTRKLDEMATTA